MYLNSNIPHFKVLIRKNFLTNQTSGFDELVEGIVFGVSSISGRMLGFHVTLNNGAIYWRLPIHAFCHKKTSNILAEDAQCWDNISYNISVTTFDWLRDLDCKVKLKSGKLVNGNYMFTIDYAESSYSESPDDHKCAHIIKLDDGNFCAYPNNRVIFKEASFVTDKEFPKYLKVNTFIYSCEKEYKTNDEDNYFYNLRNNNVEN